MYDWLNEVLMNFEGCFKREKTFVWFVVIVIGFMLRQDHVGVTSIIRELGLNPWRYEAMLHFFRSSAWSLEVITTGWIQIVSRYATLFCENNMPILVADGVKQGKEARRMPGVKRLHQESENVSKAPFIFGHMFGAVGILMGTANKLFCVPLSMRIHDGDKQINHWQGKDGADESHIVRTIREACAAVSTFATQTRPSGGGLLAATSRTIGRKSILLLDRYYLSVPALTTLLDEATEGPLLSLVMRAKRNPAAYEEPAQSDQPKRGRPRKKGDKIKVKDLFSSRFHLFKEAKVTLYGKEEAVSYYSCDLLWGQKLYHKLRFVLVLQGNIQSIFVSTDLTLTPEQIIRLYGYRFKIECSFREFKQVVAGFAYRFWSKSMPRLKRYAKSGYDPLASVSSESDKRRIINAFNAIEGFVCVASIAFGLLQLCASRFANEINASNSRWMRTYSNTTPSEATTADFMRKTIFRMIAFRLDLPILLFISERQSRKLIQARSSDSCVKG